MKLKGVTLFGDLQTILPTWFTFSIPSSFLHKVNYLKKYERQNKSNVGDCNSKFHLPMTEFQILITLKMSLGKIIENGGFLY